MSAPPTALVEQYENMRRAALQGGVQASGIGLFLETGMTEWVRTWTCLMASDAPGASPSVPLPVRRGVDPKDRELVVTVAGILWNNLKERL